MQVHGKDYKKGAFFTYRPSPVYDRSFLIFEKSSDGNLNPVGDYTVLDAQEDRSLSEKKVMNLLTLLNGGEELLNLGTETKSRLLFQRKPKADDSSKTEIVFFTYNGHGVSKENAILTIEGEFDAYN